MPSGGSDAQTIEQLQRELRLLRKRQAIATEHSFGDAKQIAELHREKCTQIAELQRENCKLDGELRRWTTLRGVPVIVPQDGEYFTASDELFEAHGWEFPEDCTVLRYDRAYKRDEKHPSQDCAHWLPRHSDGSKLSTYVHRFTSAHTFDANDSKGRTGFVTFEFECSELHDMYKVDASNIDEGAQYVDQNDTVQTYKKGEQFPERNNEGGEGSGAAAAGGGEGSGSGRRYKR